MSKLLKLWTEKYRPSDIEDYIFQDKAQQNAIFKMVLNEQIPHLILSGIQGTGKTSLAKLLVSSIGVDENDVLVLDASEKTSVDVIREEVMPFIQSFLIGSFKVVVLEEADQLSLAAQKSLKLTLEEYSDLVRFIFTCNQEHKIIAPIKSRCQQYRFKTHNNAAVEARIAEILTNEGIKFDAKDVSDYVAITTPDIRKTINLVQQYSSSGTLLPPPSSGSENADYKFKLLAAIEKDDWSGIRDDILNSVLTEEWDSFYRFIYENLNRSPKMTADVSNMKAAVVTIAEYLYRQSICADPVINADAMLIRLDEI